MAVQLVATGMAPANPSGCRSQKWNGKDLTIYRQPTSYGHTANNRDPDIAVSPTMRAARSKCSILNMIH